MFENILQQNVKKEKKIDKVPAIFKILLKIFENIKYLQLKYINYLFYDFIYSIFYD